MTQWNQLGNETGVTLIVANRAYNHAWLAELRDAHPNGYMMIVAILRAVRSTEGAAITRADVVSMAPAVEQNLQESGLRVVPSNGVALEHNGEGIGHAKFSQSKSVALLWERIGDTIYATFDDHAPVAYHRAIRHLRELRLGRSVNPMKPRTPKRILEKLRSPGTRKNSKFDPAEKFYK